MTSSAIKDSDWSKQKLFNDYNVYPSLPFNPTQNDGNDQLNLFVGAKKIVWAYWLSTIVEKPCFRPFSAVFA